MLRKHGIFLALLPRRKTRDSSEGLTEGIVKRRWQMPVREEQGQVG
jgi:hypothetical protein